MSVSTDLKWTNMHGQTRSARMVYLFQSGLHSDIKLIVGKWKERLDAHKVLLMANSPVLEKILVTDPTIVELEIPAFDAKIVRQFLQFIYTGEWSRNWKDALPLLTVANFYMVPDLAKMCTVHVGNALNVKTALPIFQQAIQYNAKTLEDAAVKEICKNAYNFVESQEFLKLSEESLQKLVVQDALAVHNENQLFDALLRWAKAECKRQEKQASMMNGRSVLQKLIPHIRFTQMDQSNFSTKVADHDFLTAEEVVSIYLFFDNPSSIRSKPMLFNSKPRDYYLPTVRCLLARLPNNDSRYLPPSNRWHAVCFKADDHVWMTSISLNHIHPDYVKSAESNYTVRVLLKDDDGKPIVDKSQIVEASKNTTNHYPIEFDDPVKIIKDMWYTASMQVKGKYYGSYFTSKSNTAVCTGQGCNSVNIEFKNCKNNGLNEFTKAEAGQMAAMGFLLRSSSTRAFTRF